MNVAYMQPKVKNLSSQKKITFFPLAPEEGQTGDQDILSRLKLSFSEEIRRAIRNNEFKLYYQPQFHVESGALAGAEAFIRWHHPDRGILFPENFISQAEYSGQIMDVGRWGLHELFHQQAKWKDQGAELINIATNISGIQFVNRSLISEVSHFLDVYKVDPAYISIELTERLEVDLDVWTRQVTDLKNLGIKISLDDFGTGYNTFPQLINVSVDFVKIDRRFIQQMTTSERAASVVESLIKLSGSLGCTAIAEGVESAGQLEKIRQFGGKVTQGFYHEAALPADEFFLKYLSK
ncbi:EAL domain-containing protein [Jeotgalibacillus aurantiacus]|uniref:EAL domain-containing protein n=1 Tax=Jeotgalibacillus aurantiacus TaxID=2763266 RepID=UPI001D0A67E6|nr:EAL domain-containing protein [Jeotgalibacillus aurantiacus]